MKCMIATCLPWKSRTHCVNKRNTKNKNRKPNVCPMYNESLMATFASNDIFFSLAKFQCNYFLFYSITLSLVEVKTKALPISSTWMSNVYPTHSNELRKKRWKFDGTLTHLKVDYYYWKCFQYRLLWNSTFNRNWTNHAMR